MYSLRNLLIAGGGTIACASLGAVATNKGTNSSWYKTLDKPAIQPPAIVFPFAWTALYAALGSSVAAALEDIDDKSKRNELIACYGLNLTLNTGWCWSFFAAQQLRASIPVAAVLAVSSADLTRRVFKVRKSLGLRLAAYPAWCTFATVLTASIYHLNKGK